MKLPVEQHINSSLPEHNVWNVKQIFVLFVAPILALLLIIAISAYFHIGSTDYVKVQTDWFLAINHYLSKLPVFWLNVTSVGDALVQGIRRLHSVAGRK